MFNTLTNPFHKLAEMILMPYIVLHTMVQLLMIFLCGLSGRPLPQYRDPIDDLKEMLRAALPKIFAVLAVLCMLAAVILAIYTLIYGC